MNDVRRANLLLIAAAIGPRPYSRLRYWTGADRKRLQDIANQRAQMDHDTAHALESGLGLPDGWMDQSHPPTRKKWQPTDQVAEVLRRLTGSGSPLRPETYKGRSPIPVLDPSQVMDALVNNIDPQSISEWLPRGDYLAGYSGLFAIEGNSKTIIRDDILVFSAGVQPSKGNIIAVYLAGGGIRIGYCLSIRKTVRGQRNIQIGERPSGRTNLTLNGPEDGQVIGVLIESRRRYAVPHEQ